MSDRRPLRFWQAFNDWWRGQFSNMGRRPNAQEIMGWYHENAVAVWGNTAPTLQETRVHAKCLKPIEEVQKYFRSYRAKKRDGSRSGTPDDEGDEDELSYQALSARLNALDGASPAASRPRSARLQQKKQVQQYAPPSPELPVEQEQMPALQLPLQLDCTALPLQLDATARTLQLDTSALSLQLGQPAPPLQFGHPALQVNHSALPLQLDAPALPLQFNHQTLPAQCQASPLPPQAHTLPPQGSPLPPIVLKPSAPLAGMMQALPATSLPRQSDSHMSHGSISEPSSSVWPQGAISLEVQQQLVQSYRNIHAACHEAVEQQQAMRTLHEEFSSKRQHHNPPLQLGDLPQHQDAPQQAPMFGGLHLTDYQLDLSALGLPADEGGSRGGSLGGGVMAHAMPHLAGQHMAAMGVMNAMQGLPPMGTCVLSLQSGHGPAAPMQVAYPMWPQPGMQLQPSMHAAMFHAPPTMQQRPPSPSCQKRVGPAPVLISSEAMLQRDSHPQLNLADFASQGGRDFSTSNPGCILNDPLLFGSFTTTRTSGSLGGYLPVNSMGGYAPGASMGGGFPLPMETDPQHAMPFARVYNDSDGGALELMLLGRGGSDGGKSQSRGMETAVPMDSAPAYPDLGPRKRQAVQRTDADMHPMAVSMMPPVRQLPA